MQQYIARRLLMFVPLLLGAALFIFIIMRILPGDVALVILSAGGEGAAATEEKLATLRHQLGLDRPYWEQFGLWLWDVVRLDFGKSLWSGEPISKELAIRLPLSLQLIIMITAVSLIISIPIGVISAIRQDAITDYFLRVFAIFGLALPSFWIGILLIMLLLLVFHWIPPLGYANFFEDPSKNMQILIWPAIAAGYRQAAVITRMTRSCMLEVIREDYIRTAWAKGLSERVVVIRHALKNSLLPVITIVGIEFAYLFGALVVTETVFTLPGMARYLVDAIYHRDYPVVQTIILILVTFVATANLLVDLTYGWLDPRIRYQ